MFNEIQQSHHALKSGTKIKKRKYSQKWHAEEAQSQNSVGRRNDRAADTLPRHICWESLKNNI